MASTWKHFLFGDHCFPLFSTFTPKPLRPTPSTTYLMRSVTWFYTLIETSSFHYQQHNMLCQHKCVQSNITTLKSSTYTTDAWADMCGKLLAFFKRSQLMATVLISHDSKQRKWLNVCGTSFLKTGFSDLRLTADLRVVEDGHTVVQVSGLLGERVLRALRLGFFFPRYKEAPWMMIVVGSRQGPDNLI